MFKIKNIILTNFGPFKGEQIIEIPEEGVTIIFGENMRGKTSLLNAIRYVLFGKIRSSSYNGDPKHNTANWESVQEGVYGFQVVLTFEQNNDIYILTRSCNRRPGVLTPENDNHYVEEFFLQKNGNVLSSDQASLELNRIMPEQVSRFFLFDGELLQEYEELLNSEANMYKGISDAIERILGVPILTTTCTVIDALKTEAKKQEADSAAKEQRTEKIGRSLSLVLDQITFYEGENKKLRDKFNKLREDKTSIENKLEKQQSARALLEERKLLQDNINEIDKRIERQYSKIKEHTPSLWKYILSEKTSSYLNTLNAKINNIEENRKIKIINNEYFKIRQQALSDQRCPICQQAIEKGLLTHLHQSLEFSVTNDQETDELHQMIVLQRSLKSFVATNTQKLIQEEIDRCDEYAIDNASYRRRIIEINEHLEGIDQSLLQKTQSDYQRILIDLDATEKNILENEKIISDGEKNQRALKNDLKSKNLMSLEKEQKRTNLYSQLSDLLNESVGIYREHLRDNIEKDATSLFQKLITENDYERLEINQNYGLTIVHKDKRKIPVRSAGASHVVALSLMGALQQNAPLQGPIIMDSPFGRLDEKHTEKVVQTLPDMANQAILLVFRSELDHQNAKNLLHGKLKREYKLVRISARHTKIERVVE